LALKKRLQKRIALKTLYIMVGRARFELAPNGLKVRKTEYLLVLIGVAKSLFININQQIQGLQGYFQYFPTLNSLK
jgi:hypothetical protein